MASGSGWNLWVWLAGGGCGWNLWVWLVGVVVRRYIDFLILLIPTLVSALSYCITFVYIVVLAIRLRCVRTSTSIRIESGLIASALRTPKIAIRIESGFTNPPTE